MTTKPRPGRSGFTLIEIMLALGVLGVGMVMVATIFPAAIHQTRQSDRNTKALLIADNARTVLSMKLTDSKLTSADSAVWNPTGSEFREIVMYNDECDVTVADGDIILYDTDAWFPMPVRQEWEDDGFGLYRHLPLAADRWPPNPKDHWTSYDENLTGWLVLARRIAVGSPEYQFMVIPYVESDALHYWPDSSLPVDDEKWLDARPRLVLFASGNGGNLLNDTIDNDYEDVLIRQFPNGRCEVWFLWNEHEWHIDEVNLGSPVILAGMAPSDEDVLGRHPTIVSLTDKTMTAPNGGDAHRAILSGPLFDRDNLPTNADTTGVSRAVYLVTTGYKPGYTGTKPVYRSKSPALGCTSFRMKLKP